MRPLDCVVVGAGIQGLSTAFWLRRAGWTDIAIVDRFGPGHDRGSSHGATRIARSSYHEPHYVRLAASAEATAWPILEHELGRPLRVRTPGLFFGPPDGPFGAYLRATLGTGAAVETLTTDAARRRFPLLRIDDGDAVLLDHTAAMLLAAETMQCLRDWLSDHDVTAHWNTRVHRVRPERAQVTVETESGELRAGRVVLAAGPWQRTLTTETPATMVLRQEVGYFDLAVEEAACAAGVFPVWARIGRATNDFQYGLPSHGGSGLKAAHHRTLGSDVDPDAAPPPVDTDALARLAEERFTAPLRALRATERCFYSMTRDQGFHVAASPSCPAIVIVAACSGHAFKFGPVIGRMAADLAMSVPRA